MRRSRQLRSRRGVALNRNNWASEWVKSESFWRDATSQAIAGLFVLLVGTLVATVVGLIPWVLGVLILAGIGLCIGTTFAMIAILGGRLTLRNWFLTFALVLGTGVIAVVFARIMLAIKGQ